MKIGNGSFSLSLALSARFHNERPRIEDEKAIGVKALFNKRLALVRRFRLAH